ncbi:hypothetical protein [Nannocystis sp. SCPEA4]|uniref:hypothetical protein n=1 Tax=Nannocystis sp. SCPEA4 TaxID=2996787 RepID=UPI0022712C23|nr:hypothetical protein [Nannocystis sp. SCPEA4]MCY1059927.1 hypothetical protein [Nannocystis sp. SCPEA4]
MKKGQFGLCGVVLAACTSAVPRPEADPAPRNVAAKPDPQASQLPFTATPASRFDSSPVDRLGTPVLVHLLIPRPAEWMAELQQHVVPSRFAPMSTPEGLLSLIAMGAGLPAKLVEKTDLTRPFGCTLGPMSSEPETACVFSYRGGAKEFAQDIEAGPADGHLGTFKAGQFSVYIDALGDDVVLSDRAGTFGLTAKYIETNLVRRAHAVEPDLEIVLFPADLLPSLRPLVAQQMTNTHAEYAGKILTYDNPAVRKALEAGASYERSADQLSLEKLAEYSQVTLFADLAHGRFALGAHGLPRPGGRFPRESLSHGRHLDYELAAGFPREVLGLLTFDMDPWALPAINRYYSGWIAEGEVQFSIQIFAALWAAASGGSQAKAEKALTRHLQEDRSLYSGAAMWAAIEHPGVPLAFIGARRLVPGQTGRDSWRAWAQRMDDGFLGGTLAEFFTWSFTPDAWRLDGVEVDRWSIHLRKEKPPRIASSLSPRTLALFDAGLVIDRLERDGHVYYVVAPGAEESVFRRLFAAQAGDRRLGDEQRFTSLRARDPQAHFLFAGDVQRIRAVVAAWPDLKAVFGLDTFAATPIGDGLDDLAVRFAETEQGEVRGELVLGPGLLKALRGP